MKPTRLALVGWAASLGLSLAWAQAPASAPRPDTLSPQVLAAIQQLSSESFEERQKALALVQKALAEQLQALVTTADPEAQAHLAALLEYSDGLSRWALDAMAVPPQKRAEYFQWGLSPEVTPILAKVFATKPETRAAGIRELGKLSGNYPTLLLERLLRDNERAVYVAAMEAVWDRPSTPAMVEALWARAVDAGMAMYQPMQQPQPPELHFRDRVLEPDNSVNYNPYRGFQDHDLATDVLAQFKSADVTAKLLAFFQKFQKDATAGQNQHLWQPYNEPMKNVFRLVESYKPREIMPVLVQVATGPIHGKNQGNFGRGNNNAFFWSSRTQCLVVALKMAEVNPVDFRARRFVQMNNQWTFSAEKDEDAAAAQLKEWWNRCKDDYLAGKPITVRPTPPVAAAPATSTAPAAPGAAPQPVRRMRPAIPLPAPDLPGG